MHMLSLKILIVFTDPSPDQGDAWKYVKIPILDRVNWVSNIGMELAMVFKKNKI